MRLYSKGIRAASVPDLPVFAGFEHLDWMARHDRRNSVFVNKLRMTVSTQKHTKIVEPGDNALQFHAINQENGEGNFVFANEIEKSVLEVLRAFCCHFLDPCCVLDAAAVRRSVSSCLKKPISCDQPAALPVLSDRLLLERSKQCLASSSLNKFSNLREKAAWSEATKA
jgi:hypothetical protein